MLDRFSSSVPTLHGAFDTDWLLIVTKRRRMLSTVLEQTYANNVTDFEMNENMEKCEELPKERLEINMLLSAQLPDSTITLRLIRLQATI